MHDGAARSGAVTRVEVDGDIATLIFDRPEKRNAMNDALIDDLDQFFSHPPEGVNLSLIHI